MKEMPRTLTVSAVLLAMVLVGAYSAMAQTQAKLVDAVLKEAEARGWLADAAGRFEHPTRPQAGETVSYTIILENEGSSDADSVEISDNLDMGPLCLDLDSVTGLRCPLCDSVSYDPMTGDRWPTLQADGQPGPDHFLTPVEEKS